MTRDDTPLVSVVIPTYYRNERLADAIDSVAEQTHDPVELIVVDDSGEANAREVVPEWATYVAFEENRGANVARTAGIERASGEYVQLLDDDDRLRPEKLARCVEVLRSDDATGVAYTGMIYEDGRTVEPQTDVRGDVLASALAFEMLPCLTSTMLIERRLLEEIVPLADRPGGDDLGLMIELATRTAFDYAPETLVERGRPPESRGRSLGVVAGRKQIVTEYPNLYDTHPEAKATALGSTYMFEAQLLLADARWSPRAIRAQARSLWHDPSIKTAIWLCVSLSGLSRRQFLDALDRVR